MLKVVLFITCIISSESRELKTNVTLDKDDIYLNSSSIIATINNNSVVIKNSTNHAVPKLLENSSVPIVVENKTEESVKLTHEGVLPESNNQQDHAHILLKIHATITRSKDAVWATIVLTFMCVLLVLAVAQSQMWKDYHGSDSQGVPLPNFNERVLFRDVMRHRMQSFKEIFKKKKKDNASELESLIAASEEEE